jgi:erythromycin esterase
MARAMEGRHGEAAYEAIGPMHADEATLVSCPDERRRKTCVRHGHQLTRWDDAGRSAVNPLRDDVHALALPLREAGDLDPLLRRIGDARFVLLGEASHGTHEYYFWRSALSRRLIEEKGFSFVAVEGDWPDCDAVHRSVTLAPDAPGDPYQALDAFERWPTWMWANEETAEFCRWLRTWNAGRSTADRAGFHGLDVYSLWDSMRAVLEYVREHEPGHLQAALRAYQCFEPYGEDPQTYAQATRFVPEGCEDEIVAVLSALRRKAHGADHAIAAERFVARQNAEVAAGAERYYRAMVRGGPHSWNVRDVHMTDTLDRLAAHYGAGAKALVWAHNTHIGDARATSMVTHGMVNLGQLVRERHGEDSVVLVGFGCHRGTVIAARRWGGADGADGGARSPGRLMGSAAAPGGAGSGTLHRPVRPRSARLAGRHTRPAGHRRRLHASPGSCPQLRPDRARAPLRRVLLDRPDHGAAPPAPGTTRPR